MTFVFETLITPPAGEHSCYFNITQSQGQTIRKKKNPVNRQVEPFFPDDVRNKGLTS